MVEEFLLHLPFIENGRFLWFAGVCTFVVGYLGGGTIQCEVWTGTRMSLILGEVLCSALGFNFEAFL